MRKHFDNVRHAIATTGTGDSLALGTVPDTWQGFADAGAANGDEPGYRIEQGTLWEIGYLTIGGGGTTATRVVVRSNVGGSPENEPIDLDGSAVLTCVLLAGDAMVGRIVDMIVQFGGAGIPIVTGYAGNQPVDFDGTILGWKIMGSQSGTMVVDIWVDDFASGLPTVADTITAAAKPTLSAAISNHNETLTGWTKDFAAGDVFVFNVDSADGTIKAATLALKMFRRS